MTGRRGVEAGGGVGGVGGAAMLGDGKSASFQTPIFCHTGCGVGTVPCCTSLIKTTLTHTQSCTHTRHLLYFPRLH